MKFFINLVLFSFFLSGCAVMNTRSYEDIMNANDANLWVPNEDFRVVKGDTGKIYNNMDDIVSRTPAGFESYQDKRYKTALANELTSLERAQRDEDYEVYERFRHDFNNDSERIYFLNLEPSARMGYLRARGMLQNYTDTVPFGFSDGEGVRRSLSSYPNPNEQKARHQEDDPYWVPRDDGRLPASY